MSADAVGVRGNEFINYFNRVPHVKSVFLNVVALNQIPKIIPTRHFLICNLSLSDMPGSHWIAITRPEKDILEIFNSLGYQSLESLMPYFKFRKAFEIHFNREQLQEENSTTCGLFCIYFIIHRILNFEMPFEHVLEDIFSTNKIENENTVTQFCSNLELHSDSNIFI